MLLRAPAKLTVSLRLVGVRADGYHLIDAEMVTLELADELTITDASGRGTSITTEGPCADGVPTDERNLVAKALALVGRDAAVHLVKQVPAQGGLGGGSSDAAAVLRWAGVSDPHLAARLGADVPFCLAGGRARVTGIGEILDPLPWLDATYTLCTPPLGISTVAAYRRWDDLGGPRSVGPNDLEPAVVDLVPEMARWRDRLGDATGATPVLAGSGATWFVEGAHHGLEPRLAPARVVVTRTDRPSPGGR